LNAQKASYWAITKLKHIAMLIFSSLQHFR
jgi:hypothetical protein